MNAPARLGPFTLETRIGEGGMGTVYRGDHRTTDVSVAIKVIRRIADREDRRRFHREVQAHAGLLHPGIVYLFEYGEVDAEAKADSDARLTAGNPYVAMELADRGTVRDWMPLADWRQVADLLVQILDALAHAHARNVVHRDLKPENFLVFDADDTTRDGPRVKLADFGIAHAFGDEGDVETRELETAAGTPAYMSPEQLQGRWRRYGPWTDLYAVGCIAWELVCGRPPFAADNLASMALRHATDERPPLDPQFPVPGALEGWIHRAMAIDPERRFRRAADALWALPHSMQAAPGPDRSLDPPPPETDAETTDETALEHLSTTVTLAETIELQKTVRSTDASSGEVSPAGDDGTEPSSDALPPSVPPPLPDVWTPVETESLPAPLIGTGLGLFGLREPPFVDRTEACGRIWEALRRVVDFGGFEFVPVIGEAGTGKSRLAEWVARRAHEVGAARIVRTVHTPEGGGNEGLTGAFERTLRTVKMDRGEVFEHLTDQLPALVDEPPELRRRDARALTEYLRPTDDDADRVDGPRYRFASGHQRRALIVRLLRRLARHRPVLVWLDDLQWGAEALDLLEAIEELPEDPPDLLALATLRSEALADRPRLADRLRELLEARPTDPIRLQPLSRAHQRELLEGLLPLEEELTDQLARRTEGHPLFAMQLLGHWIDDAAIEVGADGFRVADERAIDLPADVHDVWMERIDGLLARVDREAESAILEALELAAALGREVDAEEWRALLEVTDLDHPDELRERLIERGLAEGTADGWAFAHGLLVESLARRARRAGRWQHHNRRCAQTLETLHETGQLGPGERIAEHWVEADELEPALDALLDETRLATEHDTIREAQRLVRRRGELLDTLALPERDVRRLQQQIRTGELELHRGDFRDAKTRARTVWKRLQERDSDEFGLQIECAELLGRIGVKTGDPEQCRKWGRRALVASRRTDSDRLAAHAHRIVGWGQCLKAEFDRAAEHARRARDCATRAGDRFGRVEALRLRAAIAVERGEPEAGELYERVFREASDAGYPFVEAKAANGLGDDAKFDGRLDEARRHYRTYLQIVRALSRPTSEAIARVNLAMVDLRARRLDRVSEHLQGARERIDATGTGERWTDILDLLELTHAAGLADRPTCREIWSRIDETWLEDAKIGHDHPWLLETAGEYAREAGWEQLGREFRQFARSLWRRLGKDERADNIERLPGACDGGDDNPTDSR